MVTHTLKNLITLFVPNPDKKLKQSLPQCSKSIEPKWMGCRHWPSARTSYAKWNRNYANLSAQDDLKIWLYVRLTYFFTDIWKRISSHKNFASISHCVIDFGLEHFVKRPMMKAHWNEEQQRCPIENQICIANSNAKNNFREIAHITGLIPG